MVNPKAKLREYLKQSMRKLKHRKGYGVHSPFAYSVITEVIEEKLPYYAYHRMQRTYHHQAPIQHKVACLLLRLANRFRCRRALEIGCDGGYSLLPLVLTDSRLRATSLARDEQRQAALSNLAWLPTHLSQIDFVEQLDAIEAPEAFDMIVINTNPFLPVAAAKPTPAQQEQAAQQLTEWLMAHIHPDTLIFVRGIQPRHNLEILWDTLCDRDDIAVTMDLYDYGLAILRPNFYKQHYVVSF